MKFLLFGSLKFPGKKILINQDALVGIFPTRRDGKPFFEVVSLDGDSFPVAADDPQALALFKEADEYDRQ